MTDLDCHEDQHGQTWCSASSTRQYMREVLQNERQRLAHFTVNAVKEERQRCAQIVQDAVSEALIGSMTTEAGMMALTSLDVAETLLKCAAKIVKEDC